MQTDLIVIGSGPGGYVAAIRASQLGLKVVVVERAELGGTCLNWGCIPTKALLKSAQVFKYIQHAEEYGVVVEGAVNADLSRMVARSRGVAEQMNKGIQYLFKKNNITVIEGTARIHNKNTVAVQLKNETVELLETKHILLATGARSREFPNIKQDGKKIIGYREAMTLSTLPKSMAIIGSGAIGTEFAYFYNSLGVEVTLIEFLPQIMPLEDAEVSATLGRSFKKNKMKVMVESSVEAVDTTTDLCRLTVQTKKGIEIVEAEIVLSAVGIESNIANLGIEEVGVEVQKNKVKTNQYYQTSIDTIYAIGDIVAGPALAHVASREGIIAVEKIAGHTPEVLDYNNIPFCTYCSPEIASVGYNEKSALAAGYELKIGKFPFTASGKATAGGNREGFVKVLFDAKTDQWLGCSMIGENVTEMISEVVVARKAGVTGKQLISAIHPHPTMSEAIMEAIAAAYGEVIHV